MASNQGPLDSDVNRRHVKRLEQEMADLVADALQRGTYGTFALEFAVKDGTIQSSRRKEDRAVV